MQVLHYCIATYAFVVLQNIVMNTAIAFFCNVLESIVMRFDAKNITMHKHTVLFDAIQLQQIA